MSKSPRYPSMDLPTAIDRVRRVRQKLQHHSAPDSEIVTAMGFNSLNGASRTAASALKKYGLIEAFAGGHRVSQDAVDILMLPEDNPEHVAAVRRSAFRPDNLAELLARYGSSLPADSLMVHYLVSQRKFLQGGAEDVVKIFRKNTELVARLGGFDQAEDEEREEESGGPAPKSVAESTSQVPPQKQAASQPIAQGAPPAFAGKTLRFGTFEEDEAVLHLPINVTQESIDLIVSLLQAQKVVFPTRQATHSAIWRAPDADSGSE